MNWRRMATTAKRLVEERGGPDAVKQDAQELRKIAQGPGSWSEKAKRAAERLKQRPGEGERAAGAKQPPERAGASAAERAPSAEDRAAQEHGAEPGQRAGSVRPEQDRAA